MTDRTIKSWFEQAMPAPTIHNFQVQLGCHFEEVAEMLIELRVVGTAQHVSGHAVQEALRAVSKLADQLKQGEITVVPRSRKLLLDSIYDQNVTGTGVAHMLGMVIEVR